MAIEESLLALQLARQDRAKERARQAQARQEGLAFEPQGIDGPNVVRSVPVAPTAPRAPLQLSPSTELGSPGILGFDPGSGNLNTSLLSEDGALAGSFPDQGLGKNSNNFFVSEDGEGVREPGQQAPITGPPSGPDIIDVGGQAAGMFLGADPVQFSESLISGELEPEDAAVQGFSMGTSVGGPVVGAIVAAVALVGSLISGDANRKNPRDQQRDIIREQLKNSLGEERQLAGVRDTTMTFGDDIQGFGEEGGLDGEALSLALPLAYGIAGDNWRLQQDWANILAVGARQGAESEEDVRQNMVAIARALGIKKKHVREGIKASNAANASTGDPNQLNNRDTQVLLHNFNRLLGRGQEGENTEFERFWGENWQSQVEFNANENQLLESIDFDKQLQGTNFGPSPKPENPEGEGTTISGISGVPGGEITLPPGLPGLPGLDGLSPEQPTELPEDKVDRFGIVERLQELSEILNTKPNPNAQARR